MLFLLDPSKAFDSVNHVVDRISARDSDQTRLLLCLPIAFYI